jgi:hypothetical protein
MKKQSRARTAPPVDGQKSFNGVLRAVGAVVRICRVGV